MIRPLHIIAAWGEMFDPNFHYAIGMIQHPEAVPNTVVRVERKGYFLDGNAQQMGILFPKV
ncbi:hypothetical protein MTBBW1_1380065 [Desulfamplus magnetovallimortis]|uniref:Uncharacterized protein n=1 Tax=Desulfamplus magnetovallimortis TaxID=1246637 RepID=A0A1W1H818_9BACT|nr:hypothetical protein MTBBW1_1380065 [Desulfamplus magnetovallimortis]